MGGIVVAPYGKAFELVFPIFERTGADLLVPAWEANDVKYSREAPAGTWSAQASAPLPTAHPQFTNLWRIAFSAADLACRRLILRLADVTATKAWNDDEWEIQTKDHHLAMHKDPLLIHAGAVQAVGAQSVTLENPGPVDVPPGSLIQVLHAGTSKSPAIRNAGSYDAANRIVTLNKVWDILPTLPGEYMIWAAPDVPTTVPADIQSVQGVSAAATGLRYAGAGVVVTQIPTTGVLTVAQFSVTLTQTLTDFYTPRSFFFHGGVLDKYMGLVDHYSFDTPSGKGLITPKWNLPALPAPGDVVVLQ
jgi:hypothetical protein